MDIYTFRLGKMGIPTIAAAVRLNAAMRSDRSGRRRRGVVDE